MDDRQPLGYAAIWTTGLLPHRHAHVAPIRRMSVTCSRLLTSSKMTGGFFAHP
jgi:hypothetical protein